MRSLLFPLLPVLLLAAGCGHPASEAECQFILERIVDLELKAQKITDPTEVAKRRNEGLGLSGGASRQERFDGCIGKHITDRAVDCVRKADSAQEITDTCLK